MIVIAATVPWWWAWYHANSSLHIIPLAFSITLQQPVTIGSPEITWQEQVVEAGLKPKISHF